MTRKKSDIATEQFRLAMTYYYAGNYKAAASYFRNAADNGYAEAQLNLALMYQLGEGVEQNFKEAVKLLELAAEQKLPDALLNLALMYDHARGVDKDDVKATDLYEEAALLEQPEAQFNLAYRYYYGIGVEVDLKKSEYWFSKSAENGNSDAKDNLEIVRGVLKQLEEEEREASRSNIEEVKETGDRQKKKGFWPFRRKNKNI